MNCTNCGAPLSEGQKFCENCGSPVQAVAPQQPPVQEPVQNYEPAQQPAPAYEPVQEPVQNYEPAQQPAPAYEPVQEPVQNYEPAQQPAPAYPAAAGAGYMAGQMAADQMNAPAQPPVDQPAPPVQDYQNYSAPAPEYAAPEAPTTPAAPEAPAAQPEPAKGKKGGKSKKPLIIVLVIAALIIAAVALSKFVKPSPGPDDNETTTGEDIVIDTDEEFLEAKKSDFAGLEDALSEILCDNMEYNYKDRSAANDALNIIMNNMEYRLSCYDYYFDSETVDSTILDDDDGRFPGASCLIYDEENIDWIVENVFGAEPDHDGYGEYWYYKDGKYYEVFEPTEGTNQQAKINSRRAGDNNVYTLDVGLTVYDSYSDEDEYGNPTGEFTPIYSTDFSVTAALADVDGERVWRIFRFKSKPQKASGGSDSEGLDYESMARTVINNESTWIPNEDAYDFEKFTFWDLDFDGTPELVYSALSGSGAFSDNKFYKIENGRMTPITFGEEDGYGMEADILEFTEEPITPNIVRDRETGELYYLVSDYGRNGWEYNWTSVGLFRVVDGEIEYHELYTVGNHYNSNEDWQNGDSEVTYWVNMEESDYDGYMEMMDTIYSRYEDLEMTFFVNIIPDYLECDDDAKAEMITSAIGAFGYDGAYD